MAQILSTDAVAPRQRVSYWQEMVCQTFVQAHCDSTIGESFRGRISTEPFDAAELSRIDAGPQRIHRRAVDIARTDKPRFYLCYHLAGHARYRERDRDDLLGPGDMILLDNCEPYRAEYQDAVTSMVLHLPHELLRERFRRPERVTGRRLSAARGVTRIAGEFLQSCQTQVAAVSAAQRAALAGMALDLVSGVLAETMAESPDAGARQTILLTQAKQLIHRRLGDPDLDLGALAAALGVSVRYLCRVFQQDGLSVGRYLLQQRVEQCRRALANPALCGRQVGEIALAHGFNNFAHFSRVFRDATGCSPTEYRARALGWSR